MANLEDRMRQIAQDVLSGDNDGTLRSELETFRNDNEARLSLIEQDVKQLLSDVQTLKQSGN